MGRAFTLIEVLAVVVLVATAAGVLGVSLARTDAAAEGRRAEGTLKDLDRRARLAATRDGPVRLTLTRTANRTTVRLVGASTTLAEATFRASAYLSIEDAETDAVRYSSGGRSPDFRVRIEHAERTAGFDVAGLTGWVEPIGGDR